MRTPPRLRIAPLALALLAAGPLACASASAGSGTDVGQAGRRSDVITQQELSDIALVDKSALEAIQRLRPRFLDSRSSSVLSGSGSIKMSLDGANPQDVGELAHINVPEIAEIRYLSPGDANLRFGMAGTGGPVILVIRKQH